LVVIDTYGTQTFLDSLVVKSPTAALIKGDLKNCQRLCICLAESKALEITLERKQIKELSFPRWDIPFKEEEVREDVQKQEIAFHQNQQTPISLYEASDVIRKTVLYVATFFQNLNIGEFDRIVSLLLADQTTLIEIENKLENKPEAPVNTESTVSVTVGDQTITFNQSQKAQPNQSPSLPKIQTKKLLRDIWEEDAENILKKCFLELSVNEYNFRVIDFSLPHLRDELKQYFEDVKFIEYRNKFQKIIGLNLFFDISPQVAKAVRDLSVTMIISQPRVDSWVDWLTQIVIEALESRSTKDLEYVYYCIADLLRETLDYPEVEELAGNFLDRLVSLKHHNVVLSLSKRLRFAPQFDEYYWLEQSINRGNEAARREAYQLIYNQIKQSGSRIYEILEKVNAWLPSLERDPEKYSFSNKYALQLLIEYVIETLEEFDEKLYGEKAFSYPLFGGLRSGASFDSRLNMIVEWFLHPGVKSILDNDVDSLSIISILVFPSLFNILLGLKEEMSLNSEFTLISDALLQSINDVATRYEKKTNKKYLEIITEYWRMLSTYFLKESNHEIRINKNWNQGAISNYRRNIIDHLIEKIETLPRK